MIISGPVENYIKPLQFAWIRDIEYTLPPSLLPVFVLNSGHAFLSPNVLLPSSRRFGQA